MFAIPLEDISLVAESEFVLATIRLSSPVSNIRYGPPNKGITLSILMDRIPSGQKIEEWQDNEILKSPLNEQIPSFSVRTNLKQVQPRLIVEFSREAEYIVQAGRDQRSIVIKIKIDKPVAPVKQASISDGSFPFLPNVPALGQGASEIDQKAFNLMTSARNSLAAKHNQEAVSSLNQLLLLPPNHYTQLAQEWVGVARERTNQKGKAKVEYELYLKLYPAGPDTDRVRQRLAQLNAQFIAPATDITGEKKKFTEQPEQHMVYGSIGTHYYRGATKVDSTDISAQFGSTPLQSTFTAVDQSALITSIDVTERVITARHDSRMVFRDVSYANFLDGQPSRNRVTAAYYELKDKQYDYSVRVGRQSAYGGGVLGRFDGVSGGWGITPGFRLNAVAGQLSDYILGANPVFYGASADMGPVTVYGIRQTVEGLTDRQAIGTELRYFDNGKTIYSLLDYDTSYSALNIAMMQATLVASPERTYTLLLDHRRAPYISTRNALIGASTVYLGDLLQLLTEEELRKMAADRTGASNMAQVGFNQQLNPKWQWGGDLRYSNYEGLPASGLTDPATQLPTITGVIQATPGTGGDWGISTQLVGANLYSSNDSTVMSVSLTSSPVYKGQIYYIYNRSNPTQKWSFDTTLQYQRFIYDSGMLMTRVVPMIRTAYKIKKTLSVDFDAGMEISHTETSLQISDGQRQFFSIGLQWDF